MKKGAEEALFKLNDELIRSNQELEQFAYVASHDLQEPLRTVATFTQLLGQRYKNKLDEQANQFIHFAQDGAARSQALINDLLNFSRIKHQDVKEVDMNRAFETAVTNLAVNIEETKAMVSRDNLPRLFADESQMVSLLQNLLSNAIKFCSTIPKVHVSAEKDGDFYLFSVQDNGIGIEPQYQEKIFLIFQRLVPKDKYGGSGIGLAICKRIVERSGGKIWLEAKVGEGTTFYFKIPENINPRL